MEADVCVIGGGPAGSTIARQLAVFGRDVLVVEAQRFPRDHIGASLPAGIFPLLEAIGVRQRVEEAGFLPSMAPIVRWPHLRESPGAGFAGLHVDRAEFDAILLDHAVAGGARLMLAATATALTRTDGPRRWQIAVDGEEFAGAVHADVVVDATGRRSMSGRSARFSPPTVAIYAYGERDGLGDGAGRIDAGSAEWLWHAPVTERRSISAIFIEPKRLSGLDAGGIDQLFRDLLGKSGLIGPCVAQSPPGAVRICDASGRMALRHAEIDLIRVGDASLAIDPLSSQGVQVAMASALQGAVVVNTLLKGGDEARNAAEFYEARQREKQEMHRLKAAAAYAEVAAARESSFWTSRAVGAPDDVAAVDVRVAGPPLDPDCIIRVSRQVTYESTPVIRGRFVGRTLAVRTPGLARPVAFLQEVDVAPLLLETAFDRPARAICRDWEAREPRQRSWQMLQWLWQQRIVEASATAPH